MNKLEAVYFDLDGTLIDTAPDFYTVLNTLLKQHGRPEVSYSAVRANVSNGARALTELGFGVVSNVPFSGAGVGKGGLVPFALCTRRPPEGEGREIMHTQISETPE